MDLEELKYPIEIIIPAGFHEANVLRMIQENNLLFKAIRASAVIERERTVDEQTVVYGETVLTICVRDEDTRDKVLQLLNLEKYHVRTDPPEYKRDPPKEFKHFFIDSDH